MRLKPVPDPPADLGGLAAARRAVPLVPGTEDDCCARLRRRLDLDAREQARTWLTFLRALGLAEETARGYARTRLGDDGDDGGEGGDGDDGREERHGGGAGDSAPAGDLPPRAELAAAFRENVFGAREVLNALADAGAGSPLGPEAAFERVEPAVPRWERHRDPTWREAWRERVRRLLAWAVLLGLAERVDGGYRPAEG